MWTRGRETRRRWRECLAELESSISRARSYADSDCGVNGSSFIGQKSTRGCGQICVGQRGWAGNFFLEADTRHALLHAGTKIDLLTELICFGDVKQFLVQKRVRAPTAKPRLGCFWTNTWLALLRKWRYFVSIWRQDYTCHGHGYTWASLEATQLCEHLVCD